MLHLSKCYVKLHLWIYFCPNVAVVLQSVLWWSVCDAISKLMLANVANVSQCCSLLLLRERKRHMVWITRENST